MTVLDLNTHEVWGLEGKGKEALPVRAVYKIKRGHPTHRVANHTVAITSHPACCYPTRVCRNEACSANPRLRFCLFTSHEPAGRGVLEQMKYQHDECTREPVVTFARLPTPRCRCDQSPHPASGSGRFCAAIARHAPHPSNPLSLSTPASLFIPNWVVSTFYLRRQQRYRH